MAEQMPFDLEIELAPNPEPRCPCVLLLDVSRSMAGTRISLLNEGLQAYRDELNADSLASQRVEVAVVTFGGDIEVVCPFVTASLFQPPTLKVHGDTPMGRAVTQGIEMIAVCAKEKAGGDTVGMAQTREAMVAERYNAQAKRYLEQLRREAIIEPPR